MADEEEKVVAEKKGGSNNLILIVGVALIVISLALSAVSLITIMQINSKINTPEGEEEAGVDTALIPLTEITSFDFADEFIFIFNDVENDLTHNIVVSITIGMHNKADDFTDVQTTLTNSEKILRSGIEGMINGKTHEVFATPQSMELLEEEIRAYLNERLLTETVIDVYFHNKLTSTK